MNFCFLELTSLYDADIKPRVRHVYHRSKRCLILVSQ